MLPASRSCLRSTARSTLFTAPSRTAVGRRFISTEAPHLRSRSWKSSALRWGVAIAGIYYYNTSPVFAERPESNLLNPDVDALEDDSQILDTLTASSRRKSEKDASVLQSAIEQTSADDAASDLTSTAASNASIAVGSPGDLEEEAAGEGAFNPETGEINWDCPCLGGMAHGPCGPEFREAFSCFVYSTEEPKGMNCIDKFQNMQNCFRAHPEVYKGEIEDEEELDAELAQEKEELAKEIADRKKAVEDKSSQQPTNRLLEEPAKAEKPKKTRKNKKDQKSTSSESSTHSQPEIKAVSTSEPHPGMSAEHEALSEGASSPLQRSPAPQYVDPASTIDHELVPRAAHDATANAN